MTTHPVPRKILEKIAAQITGADQENLQYVDEPGYNDQAGSGFFPDFRAKSESTHRPLPDGPIEG